MSRFWQRWFGRQAPSTRTGPAPADWAPTHRHRKGGLYRLIGHGIAEATRSPVAIYDDEEGTIWVRDADEFADGRFTPLK